MTASARRRLRRRLGLSQVTSGELVGVPGNTIARWDRGEMHMGPARDRLVRFAVGEAEWQRAVASTDLG